MHDRGGGILSANPIELNTICTTPDSECKIDATKLAGATDIKNNNSISLNKITLETAITTFTNTNNLTLTSNDGKGITITTNGKIDNFINSGNISNGIYIPDVGNALTKITNYGEMQGVYAYKPQHITIDNRGTIKTSNATYFTNDGNKPAHFIFEDSSSKISIENFKIKILESASEFNAFTSYASKTDNKNSHLIIWRHSNGKFVEFKDEQSKLLLDVGDGFEFGVAYKIAKLVTDQNGDSFSDLGLDFSRLALSDEIKDLYSLINSGDSFIIRLMNKITETPITAIYKANIRTMNNFYTMSNSMIYPRKSYHSQNLGRAHSLLQHSPSLAEGARGWVEYPSLLDSANHLKSYESFAYRSEAINRRIQRQNKRNYNRKSQNLNTDSANKNNQNNPSLRADSQNLRGNPNLDSVNRDYYFILTPFINYNSFAESGRYNLNGFDYGFLTAFSARVAESNSLGAHFMMSYGTLSDKKDKDLSIKSLNINAGVNYKLDLIWDMFIKARGDFFYFSNELDSATLKNIKPSNLGFGASVSYGKEWDFKSGGVLGIEAGLDYKALKTNEVSLNSQTYKQSLLNLIYADLGVNYAKYFGGFGVSLGTGFRANLAPKLAESALLVNSQNLRFTLDNDKYLGYANAGISYVLNAKNFDMEFSLAYYGNYGDRAISNAGGFEWRVLF